MFDFDAFREILATIRKNKLRTILTGFSVSWGIFMLITLLSAGNGFRNGVTSNFSDRAKNSITIWPGWTSIPYKGMPSNRQIKFDDKDYNLIKNRIPGVEYVSPRISRSTTITYNKEYGSWQLNGVAEDYQYIRNIKVEKGQGRFLNEMDIKRRRKVIVISTEIQKILFKEDDAIGKYVTADGLAYQVIGVYDNKNQYMNNPPAYIPFTTAQMLYNNGWGFSQIDFTINGLKTIESNKAFIETLRARIGSIHIFDPKDQSALHIYNQAEFVEQTEDMFNSINLFLKVISVAMLILGIIGVGNIMLITVNERTQEIGIRKAIGASPISILKMIIFESLFITSIAGYIGLAFGLALSELLNAITEKASSGGGPSILKDPTVDMGTAITACAIVIVAGVAAGLIPALKAVKVRPIEAMRTE